MRSRGLHDLLYGDEEDHGATAQDGSFEPLESFDGTSLYNVSTGLCLVYMVITYSRVWNSRVRLSTALELELGYELFGY